MSLLVLGTGRARALRCPQAPASQGPRLTTVVHGLPETSRQRQALHAPVCGTALASPGLRKGRLGMGRQLPISVVHVRTEAVAVPVLGTA